MLRVLVTALFLGLAVPAAAQTVVDGSAAGFPAEEVRKVLDGLKASARGGAADIEVRKLARADGGYGYCGEVRFRGDEFSPFHAGLTVHVTHVFVLPPKGHVNHDEIYRRLRVFGCIKR